MIGPDIGISEPKKVNINFLWYDAGEMKDDGNFINAFKYGISLMKFP